MGVYGDFLVETSVYVYWRKRGCECKGITIDDDWWRKKKYMQAMIGVCFFLCAKGDDWHRYTPLHVRRQGLVVSDRLSLRRNRLYFFGKNLRK